MFFEPQPARAEPARRRLPDVPEWWGPPELEQGGLAAHRGELDARDEQVYLPAVGERHV